jgi:hypothetical protein
MKTKNQKPKTFEYLCYIFAGLCALMFFFTHTTSGSYVNFDGSNTALRWEIAFFGWLIVGRITALINKKTCIEQEQQSQIPLNTADKDKLSDDSSEFQKNEMNYDIREFSEQIPNYEQYEAESFAIYKKSNHIDEFKRMLTPLVQRINRDRAKLDGNKYDFDSIVLYFWNKFNKMS